MQRIVRMIELSHTKQWKDEHVVNHINKRRSLNMNCRELLYHKSAIDIYIQGMQWNLQYILKGFQSNTFEELAMHKQDMKLSIIGNQKLKSNIEQQ